MAFTLSDLFGVFIAMVIYFQAIGPQIKSIITDYLATTGASGLEAFFISMIPWLIPAAFVWYIVKKSTEPQTQVYYYQ